VKVIVRDQKLIYLKMDKITHCGIENKHKKGKKNNRFFLVI